MQSPTGKGSDISLPKGLAKKLANDRYLTFVDFPQAADEDDFDLPDEDDFDL